MTWMSGRTCELRVLQGSEEEARIWAQGVMGSVTLEYTLTGSIPMKWMEIQDEWRKELAQGAMIFGIYKHGYRDMVGTVGLYRPYPVYRSYEFRIIIWDKDAVGKGIGTEACWMVTDYGFRALNAHRVSLGVHEDNTGAIRVYEKVGYVREGVLRDAIYCYGKYSNTLQYSMLRDEWLTRCEMRKVKNTGNIREWSSIAL